MDTAITPMVWAPNLIHDNKDRCACCGKELAGKSFAYVEVINGGDDVAHPELGPGDTTDPGYMGFYPVGPSCARKYFKGFTHQK